MLNCTPSAFMPLLDINRDSRYLKLQNLRIVFLGGEPINQKHLRTWLLDPNCNSRVVNTYGPTECTDIAAFFEVDRNNIDMMETIPIGKPINNVSLFLSDDRGRPVPIGLQGEILIGGAGLGLGYYKDQGLTDEKYVNLPLLSNEKVYRTGDIGVWDDEGNIVYCGRKDHQVKIRGYRVELGDIEHHLLLNPNVKEAVVIYHRNERQRLVAYLVLQDESCNSLEDVKMDLSSKLPIYMLPEIYKVLKQMPLSVNGKIDKDALGKIPLLESGTNDYQAPESDFEKMLCEIWMKIFVGNQVGITDDFFALGGDSIKAIQIVSRMKRFGLNLSVRDIFNFPNIKYLVKRVKLADPSVNKGANEESLIGPVEMLPAQKWFFSLGLNESRHHWNQSFLLVSKERLREHALKETLKTLAYRHDVLRMIFPIEEGQVRPCVISRDEFAVSFQTIDISHEALPEEKVKELSEKIQCSLDINNGHVWKTVAFRTYAKDYILFVMHHLLIDGISWRILFEELGECYKAVLEKRTARLPEKTTSIKEWEIFLNSYANKVTEKHDRYWERLSLNKTKPFPADCTIENLIMKNSSSEECQLNEYDTKLLLGDVNNVYNTEINNSLLLGLGQALCEWIGHHTFLLGMESHGREISGQQPDISRTIGWFALKYPFVLTVEDTDDIGYQMKSVRDQRRSIPSRGVDFEISRYCSTTTGLSNNAFHFAPSVSFNYLGQFDKELQDQSFTFSNLQPGNLVSPNSKDYAIFILI